MSLNWREIDLVLSELDLDGAKIERVIQPSFDSISLGLYKAGRSVELLISIAHGACRLHSLRAAPPKPAAPLRFMECLRSRIRGGRIESVRQLGGERIVRFDIAVPRAEEAGGRAVEGAEAGRAESPIALRRYRLYARLWSGAGNLVLADESGTVVDALARRPRRGEVSGGRCAIEEAGSAAAADTVGAPAREFSIRDLPGEGGFNERLEAWYAARGGGISRDRLLAAARERIGKRRRALELRASELERRAAEFRDGERLRELGDILMARADEPPAGKFMVCEDFFRGGEVSIPVDPASSMVENARSYYERYRKAASGLGEVEAELSQARAAAAALDGELARLEAIEDPFLLARALEKGGAARPREERSFPGLSLERGGWTILVGRSAKENDELLRRRVRGSDLWLHARDWPGSYVFVKARRDKTVPLDILLDAGNLAIYYSKGRANRGGDVYYTFVKYLRRAKDGPRGLVIPTQEKNLSIDLDEGRLRELKALIGEG